ncbi:MAG: hypothetical protein ACTS85_03820 [Arsenophonus sp. NC-PG7-MAG3]
MKVLEILNNSFEYFNKSEKKVVNSVLENLKAVHFSIATLAKLIKIKRSYYKLFYRKIDTNSFPNF